MNGPSGPISPHSINGSDWSGGSQYQSSGLPPHSPTLPLNRGNLVTPPISGSSTGIHGRMSNGMNHRPGDPSPPHSVARSSYGTATSVSDGQRRKTLQMEDRLSQHYAILKRFLNQSLRDEQGNPKPNRARDKLLRLSPVQFQELSTDVYDELLRRQSSSGQQTNGPGQVPPYLLPKENFHPKRNQARQKLATLPPPRFQDLATDVFYELERRFPVFAGREISRVGSPASSIRGPPSRVGSPNGMRYGRRKASLGSQVMAGLGIPGMEGQGDSQGRPTAKTFQSSTIIPNKSTMVEDDDEEASDIYGTRRNTTLTSRSIGGSERDRKAIAEFESQVEELQGRVEDLEERVRGKDSALAEMQKSRIEEQSAIESEKARWKALHSELESKLEEARDLNANLQSELDKVRNNHTITERSLRSQVDALAGQVNGEAEEWRIRYEELDNAHQDLRTQLLQQEKVTSEVKQEATGFLQQMKALSERSNQSCEGEERLIHQVQFLEKRIQEWKSRYARTRTQMGILRASSTATSIEQVDAVQVAKDGGFIAPDGLVKDVHIATFQIAIDELLQSARENEPTSVLGHVRSVAVAVREIILDIGDTQISKDEVTQQKHKLRAKVSATANNVITASRNYASSKGLSPVSLLDAAASHLTAAIVGLVQFVKICPTPVEDFDNEDEESVNGDFSSSYYGISSSLTGVGTDSAYPVSDLQSSAQPKSKGYPQSKPVQNGESDGIRYSTEPKRTHGIYTTPNNEMEELKSYLETHSDDLRYCIQSLIDSIRTSASRQDILKHLDAINSTTSQIISKTHDASPSEQSIQRLARTLSECRDRLEDKSRETEEIDNEAKWSVFVKDLPPLAFEIHRHVKELGTLVQGGNGEEFN